MRRIRTALAVAAIVLAFGVQSAQPAEAAVPPVPYTGSVNIDYLNNGSAGGVLQRGDRYYLMTVAHIAGPLYTQHWVVKPGNYPLGGTAYNANSGSAPKDIALIELGTTRPSPRMRVCNAASCPTPPGYTVPQVATIESTPTSADLPYGKIICHSGWSSATDSEKYGGYRCGIADNAGDYACTQVCGMTNINGPETSIADGGDSGGPVWQPLPSGGIRLLGFVSNTVGPYPYQRLWYRPIWHYTTYNWTAAQSCSYCTTGPGGVVLTGS